MRLDLKFIRAITPATVTPRRSWPLAAGIAAIALASPAVASAATPGAPDTTFGKAGLSVIGSGVQLFGTAAQPDGSVIVSGESGGRAFVARLNGGGAVQRTWTGSAGVARAVAAEPNGDIVVAGTSAAGMFVERLTSALTPDLTFGLAGSTTLFAGQTPTATSVAAAPDGTIAVGGYVGNAAGSAQAALARLSARGDAQWSKTFSFGGNSVVSGVAVQPGNDAIVFVGSQNPGQVQNAVLGRLTSAGGLDSSFHGGQGAFTYTYPGSGATELNAVVLQGDGKIVAAGAAAEGPTALVLRLNPDGTFDPGFGHGGIASAAAGQNVNLQDYAIGAYGVGIGAGGTIIAAGNYENTGVIVDQALWAFTPNGAPVAGFGTGGTELYPVGNYEACGLAVLPSGNPVTVGDSVPSLPDATPCTLRSGSIGFAARFVGFGASGTQPPPAFQAALFGLSRSYSARSAHRHGIRLGVGCNAACRIQMTVGASASVARALKIGRTVRTCTTRNHRRRCTTHRKYTAFTVQRAGGRLTSSGVKGFTLASRTFERAVVAFRTVRLQLHVVVTSSSGKRVTINRTLTFR